jgi:hypothetical protein
MLHLKLSAADEPQLNIDLRTRMSGRFGDSQRAERTGINCLMSGCIGQPIL